MVGAPVKPTGPPAPTPPPKPRPAGSREGNGSKRNGRPAPFVCIILSLIIVWHFTAIFLAAMSVPGPTSPLIYNIAQEPPVAWYLDALYLNQGHSFFAPDVGPGHIIRYALMDQSNRVIEDGTLPDKLKHTPRLFYHRHMMLADQADMGDEQQLTRRKFLEAYARHLLRTNKNAQSAKVSLYAHWPLPTSYAYPDRARGYQLLQQDISREAPNRRIDSEGFELVAEGVQRRSDLPPDPNDQSSIPPPYTPTPNVNWQSERPNVAGRWSGGPR